jgi:hypothetical protein
MKVDIEITKDCYLILCLGMGNVDILPDLNKKGKIYKDVEYDESIKKITSLDLKKELEKHGVGIAFMADTNYEYESIILQCPQSALVPVGCFKII